MPNTRYIRCSKCGNAAFPRGARIVNGKLEAEAETGTLTIMRCPDCDEHSKTGCTQNCKPGYATMCRDCCPTGHGTHAAKELQP